MIGHLIAFALGVLLTGGLALVLYELAHPTCEPYEPRNGFALRHRASGLKPIV